MRRSNVHVVPRASSLQPEDLERTEDYLICKEQVYNPDDKRIQASIYEDTSQARGVVCSGWTHINRSRVERREVVGSCVDRVPKREPKGCRQQRPLVVVVVHDLDFQRLVDGEQVRKFHLVATAVQTQHATVVAFDPVEHPLVEIKVAAQNAASLRQRVAQTFGLSNVAELGGAALRDRLQALVAFHIQKGRANVAASFPHIFRRELAAHANRH